MERGDDKYDQDRNQYNMPRLDLEFASVFIVIGRNSCSAARHSYVIFGHNVMGIRGIYKVDVLKVIKKRAYG